MQACPDLLSLLRENAGEPRRGPPVARPVQDRCDVPDIYGRDAYPLIHKEAGIGSVVVAGLWLVFYVIASMHSLAFAN